MATLESLTDALNKTCIEPAGVSFAGRGLKLNNEEDAEELVKAIDDCKYMQFLNLEGNTLGINASKAIATALEKHGEFKRALWKDLFTGRMKDEIPIALRHLGEGLLVANARLVELDLSDNAFGPIGVEGLATLLKSSCCFELEELRLNNNGLGIGGGKLLASALLQCHNASKGQGKPLALKVFIAGRNRLENLGATALAKVFETIGTLEEIAMPQNGIYHEGIDALAKSFRRNPNLQIINLNDNTITYKGARALANAIPRLKQLRAINFGDCLLKTKGVIALVDSLTTSNNIEEIVLDCNEMRKEAAFKLITAIEDKPKLKKLSVNGNCFGDNACKEIERALQRSGKGNVLESLDEDEGDEDADADDSCSESSASEDEGDHRPTDSPWFEKTTPPLVSVSVETFLTDPSVEKFMGLGDTRADLLLKYAQTVAPDKVIQSYMEVLMNVASLINKTEGINNENVAKCSEMLCMELFTHGQRTKQISIVNNTLLVYLKLIKAEDKKFTARWDINGCFNFIEGIVNKNYFPSSTKDVLKYFIERDIANEKQKSPTTEAKKNLLKLLH